VVQSFLVCIWHLYSNFLAYNFLPLAWQSSYDLSTDALGWQSCWMLLVLLHKEMKLLSGPVTTIFCYFSMFGCNEHVHQYVLLLSGFPDVASSRNLSEFLLEFFSHFCHLNVLFWYNDVFLTISSLSNFNRIFSLQAKNLFPFYFFSFFVQNVL
jgi:hypothetical protein